MLESDLKQALDMGLLNIPEAKHLPGSNFEVPFMLLGDDAYPLRTDLMKSYPFRQLDHQQRVFNYRLSRGRRVVENGFGILANRWRVFRSTIMINPDKVQKIVLSCVCLHNYLCEVRSDSYTADTEDAEHRLIEGTWREDGLGAKLPLQQGRPCNSSMVAKQIRDKLKSYFVTPAGQVPWQENYI